MVLDQLVQQEGAARTPLPTPEQPQPVPVTAPAPPSEATAPTPEVADEGHASETSIVPFIIMGAGGAMVLGSIATGLMASSAESEIDDKCPTRMNCPASVKDAQSRGETMALLTDVLLFGGIAAAGTGVALWLLGTFDERQPVASAACVPGACIASLAGRF